MDDATAAARALARARQLCDERQDAAALEQVEKSLRILPVAENTQAAVLRSWLQMFGEGSEADTTVRRILACPSGDFYAVLGVPRYGDIDRKEYLKLSLLLHPECAPSMPRIPRTPRVLARPLTPSRAAPANAATDRLPACSRVRLGSKCGARNAEHAFKRVTEAHNTLNDPEQRGRYDDKLRRTVSQRWESADRE